MSFASMGALLPRDFLERQPKRWQKSQRKRRVLGTLKKMKAKREKLEQRVVEQAQRDAGIDSRKRRDSTDRMTKEVASDAPAPPAPVLQSHSTPIGPHARGFWAAELAPFQALVVKLPEGVELCLLRATIKASNTVGNGTRHAEGSTRSAVRCRTPAHKEPTTLCVLEPLHSETCGLNALFSSADRGVAVAVEGPDVVHVIGCYVRPGGAVLGESSRANGAAASHSPQPPPQPPPSQAVAAPSKAAPAAPKLVELAEGLKYTDVKAGKGRRAARGNRLAVKYVGLAPNSRAAGGWSQFDDNGGRPFHFVVGDGEVIRGWDMGLIGMRQGGTRRLVIPHQLGYGEGGAGPVPPRATLIFEVTLLNVTGGGGGGD